MKPSVVYGAKLKYVILFNVLNMKKITGILFLLTLFAMIGINSCKNTADFYAIDQSKCQYCLECVPVCGYHAINMVKAGNEFDRDTLIIDPNKCVGCGECVIACDKKGYFAIAAAH